MAPKTETTTPETHACACGCGAPVARVFKQGHDQRLVSRLAEDVVYGSIWDGRCMGILTKVEARTADQQVKIDKVVTYVASKLSDSLANKVSNAAHRQWELQKTADARQAKRNEKAAKPKRERKGTATAKAAPSEEAGNAKEPKLITKAAKSNADVDAADAALDTNDGTGPGGPRYAPGVHIRVLIGKRKRNAVVRGMNQNGMVTAIAVTTNGKETVIDDPERFTILSS